jgi:hypothetical protein
VIVPAMRSTCSRHLSARISPIRNPASPVIGRVREISSDEFDAVELLRECDLDLAQGGRGIQTTAVVAVVDETSIKGASVGDSRAWLFGSADQVDLTHRQVRKPLIGTGEAWRVPFIRAASPLLRYLLRLS